MNNEMNNDLKALAAKFRRGGTTSGDFRLLQFTPDEMKMYADLLDPPPRFTEAQMAFLKGCYGIGIVGIMRSGDGARTHFFTKFETIGWLKNSEIPLELGETLDLAELLGKDGAE